MKNIIALSILLAGSNVFAQQETKVCEGGATPTVEVDGMKYFYDEKDQQRDLALVFKANAGGAVSNGDWKVVGKGYVGAILENSKDSFASAGLRYSRQYDFSNFYATMQRDFYLNDNKTTIGGTYGLGVHKENALDQQYFAIMVGLNGEYKIASQVSFYCSAEYSNADGKTGPKEQHVNVNGNDYLIPQKRYVGNMWDNAAGFKFNLSGLGSEKTKKYTQGLVASVGVASQIGKFKLQDEGSNHNYDIGNVVDRNRTLLVFKLSKTFGVIKRK